MYFFIPKMNKKRNQLSKSVSFLNTQKSYKSFSPKSKVQQHFRSKTPQISSIIKDKMKNDLENISTVSEKNSAQKDFCITITKEMISAISQKIIEKRIEKDLKLSKTAELNNLLEKEYLEYKKLCEEQKTSQLKLLDFSKKELIMKNELNLLDIEFKEKMHNVMNYQNSGKSEKNVLEEKIEFSKKSVLNNEQILNKLREKQKEHSEKLFNEKQKLELENSLKQKRIEELRNIKNMLDIKEANRTEIYKAQSKNLFNLFKS